MGIAIHGKRDDAGGFCYRIWSTSSDVYITGKLTEQELRDMMLSRRLQDAVAAHLRRIDDDIHDAQREDRDGSGLVTKWRRGAPQGKSSALDPNDPWVKQYRLECELAEVAAKAIKDHLAKKKP